MENVWEYLFYTMLKSLFITRKWDYFFRCYREVSDVENSKNEKEKNIVHIKIVDYKVSLGD